MGRILYRILSRLVLHPWFRLTRGLTLGVRILVQNPQGHILLVRHTYSPGWLLPGGGVERGEIAIEAAAREVLEETGVSVTQPLKLIDVYNNDAIFPGDHVLLYLGQTDSPASQKGNLEIAEARFFAPTELPEDTTAGTIRRIREMLDAAPAAGHW
ncbi:MAG: NUDIX domain-containing protein [Alphaproteobacteria bacterium]|nr:NUDIX domain-containing protein [Alphaproteobacteria bacterium]